MTANNKTQRLPRPSAVLWDMDGTLIDQTEAIIRCFGEVVASFDLPAPAPDTIRRSMGGPLAATMELFIDGDRMDEACRRFRRRFPEIMFDGLVILPGGPELIRRFHTAGITQAIFTNKHGETARRISRHAGFSKHIAVCVGSQDSKWHKPQAELTREVLARVNATTEGACLIGDSPTDIETAHNAGIPCYTVATGAHGITELKEAGAEAAFADLRELGRAFDL